MFVPIALALLLALPFAETAAQVDTVVVIPHLRVEGDRYQVAVEKAREEYEVDAGGLLLVDRVWYEWLVDVDVRGRRPGGFSVAWTYRPPAHAAPSTVPAYEPETGTLANVRIVFAADANGRPRFVLNPLWVRQRLFAAMDRAARYAADDQLLQMEIVRAEAATQEGLGGTVLADPERLYLMSGRRLVAGRTVTGGSWIDNPFGEGRIAAEEVVRMDSLSADGSRAFVHWSLVPDRQDLAAVVQRLLEDFSPGGINDELRDLLDRFNVRETAVFEIDLDRGTVLLAHFKRSLSAADRVRIDEVILRTLPPERR